MAVPSGGMAVGGGRRFRRIRWYIFFNHQSIENQPKSIKMFDFG